MNSDTRSLSDCPEWQDIIVACYGGGETFPYRSLVTVSTEDTVAGFKDHVFDKAEEEGFSMTGIDQQSMIVYYMDDNDKKTYRYLDDTKLKDFNCTPRFAFLPGFFLLAKGFNLSVEDAMRCIDHILFVSPPFKIEVFLRDGGKPRPFLGARLQVNHHEVVVGVKELIIRRLFPGKSILPKDILLIFCAGDNLKCVSTPAESLLWPLAGWKNLAISIADDLKVKTFLDGNKLTAVDVLDLSGQMDDTNLGYQIIQTVSHTLH